MSNTTNTQNIPVLTVSSLEFENGRLVKVNGQRPEYMDGWQLIALVRDLGSIANGACERICDMYRGDDGQAWDEAGKFLKLKAPHLYNKVEEQS